MKVIDLEPSRVKRHPLNPREPSEYSDEAFGELRASIARYGVQQPAVVRPVGEEAFELIIGHRRHAVCRELGKPLPVHVANLDDDTALALLLSEAETSQAPDPFAESDAVAYFLQRPGWGIAQVAEALGKSGPWVAKRSRLRHLVGALRDVYRDPASPVSRWPVRWLERLALLPEEDQRELAADDWWLHSDYPLEDRRVGNNARPLGDAPWKLADEELVPAAGACARCPKQSGHVPELFQDVEDLDEMEVSGERCMDRHCWREKLVAHRAALVAEKQKRYPALEVIKPFDQVVPPGVNARDSWVMVPAKKTDPGAVPMLELESGSGKVTWRKSSNGRSRTTTAGGKAKPAAPKTPAQKLAAGRERIGKRRQAHVVDAVAALVRDMDTPPFETVRRLVPVYGCALSLAEDKPNAGAGKERYRKTAGERAWANFVWERMKKRLLETFIRGSHIDVADQHKRAAWLLETLGLEVGTFDEAAIDSLPDPKGWAKLEEQVAKAKPKRRRRRKAATS